MSRLQKRDVCQIVDSIGLNVKKTAVVLFCIQIIIKFASVRSIIIDKKDDF